MTSESPSPSNYAPLLADLKQRVRAAQVKAAVSVNSELIRLYWHVGREILRAQEEVGWGGKVGCGVCQQFSILLTLAVVPCVDTVLGSVNKLRHK